MPSSRNLEFADIDDFSPGIFNASDWLVPPTAAQVMTDCHPEVGGGLRAAFKPTSFSVTGLTATNERVIGIYSRGAIALRTGTGDASDRYLWTFNSSDNKVRVYRWDETNGDTSWAVIKTHAAVSATPNPVQADTFVDSGGTAYVVYNLAQTSTDDGLWSIQYSNGTVTKRLAGFVTACAVQDDRIIGAIGSELRWSDSQSVSSFPAANSLKVQSSRQGSTITSITPFAPGDLLIGTRYSAWTLVQGDITDPIVRTMSDARTVAWGQTACFTEGGLAFIAPNQGVFLTSTGETFADLSAQLDRATFVQGSATAIGDVGGGNLAYMGPFLLAPHGYLYDFRTKSWFRSGVLSAAADHFHSYGDRNYRQLFAATGGVAYGLYTLDAKESTRYNTYTWKSAPLRRPDGRQVELREIQVYARAYDADATVAVTVNGTTKTVTFDAAGKQQGMFLFSERAEVLDVQVVPAAASSSVEAPSIEVVRIGTHSRHQLR